MKSEVSIPTNSQTWVLGVSGGPDSMALLDSVNKAKIKCFVVHVNYQLRKSSMRDQMIVEKYCEKHSIPCFIFNAPYHSKGNFQDYARIFRYDKMIEIQNQVNADAIVVAHHKDDDIETFLFQKERKSCVDYYGLKEEGQYKKSKLIRPFIKFHKSELIEYCELNQIEFGIDESNENLKYVRNRIREQLRHFTTQQKEDLLKQKEEFNTTRHAYLVKHQYDLEKTSMSMNTYLNLDRSFLLEWLRYHHVKKSISSSFIKELDRQIRVSNSFVIKTDSKRIIKQYNRISLIDLETKSYLYLIETLTDLITSEFTLSFTNDSKNHIKLSDFPLTIKNATGQELVGHQKLNRWFIEHKIPLEKRELWPVVSNSNGKIIYIPNVAFMHGLSANKITLTVVK